MESYKKNQDDLTQIAAVDGVAGLEDYHAEEGKSSNDKESLNSENIDDDRFMEGLFANSGVYSTLKHDSLVSGSQQDNVLIEREASRVAKEAAAALRASSRAARKAEIGTPTWTGCFGTAGKDHYQISFWPPITLILVRTKGIIQVDWPQVRLKIYKMGYLQTPQHGIFV